MKKVAQTLALAGAASCAVLTATPAHAATYTPESVCGSGYTVVDHHNLYTTQGNLMATIYLAWNGSYNCVTTFNRTGITEPWSMSATLQVQGKPQQSDSGDFTYFAGPVRGYAPATCVKWGGKIDIASWTSDWSHCR